MHTGTNELQLRVLHLNTYLVTPNDINICIELALFSQTCQVLLQTAITEIIQNGEMHILRKSGRCTPAVMRFTYLERLKSSKTGLLT